MSFVLFFFCIWQHFLTFGWKILFSLVPPVGLFGGWLSFFVSLAMIGLLTAIIGDMASIFGCLVGLEDSVTAITFVALGTSLPDLFASRAAARAEKHADNAIGKLNHPIVIAPCFKNELSEHNENGMKSQC